MLQGSQPQQHNTYYKNVIAKENEKKKRNMKEEEK
jgi:hypothetical protein